MLRRNDRVDAVHRILGEASRELESWHIATDGQQPLWATIMEKVLAVEAEMDAEGFDDMSGPNTSEQI